MSVMTTADEIIEDFRKDLDRIIFQMKRLIFDEVWGWDDYKKEYRENMLDNLVQLKKMRDEYD